MNIRIAPALGALAAALLLGSPSISVAYQFGEQDVKAEGAEGDPPAGETSPRVLSEEEFNQMFGEQDVKAEGEEGEDEPACNYLNDLIIGKCLSEKTGFLIYGWADAGVLTNDNPTNYNGPVTFADQEGFLLNQLYLVAERVMDTEKNFDIGGRVDLLYGSDWFFTQSLGLDQRIIGSGQTGPANTEGAQIYNLAIPQLYASMYLGIGPGVTVKAGHFYTIIGYEVVTAPDNFFYTHAYTMQYGEPFTHTGVLASSDLTDWVSVTAGITRGWDNWIDNNNGLSPIGGITLKPTETTTIALAGIFGPEQDEPFQPFTLIEAAPGQYQERYMYSLVVTQEIKKFTYVFQHDYGMQFANTAIPGQVNAEWYGINQYLFYNFTDELAFGVRGEWFRDASGTRVFGLRNQGPTNIAPGSPSNYYEVSLGLNWRPYSCVNIRPQVRWDWQDQSAAAAGLPPIFNNGTSSTQFTYGGDIVFRF